MIFESTSFFTAAFAALIKEAPGIDTTSDFFVVLFCEVVDFAVVELALFLPALSLETAPIEEDEDVTSLM